VLKDPSAAGGGSVSLMLGNSRSQSTTVQTSQTARASQVAAGQDVRITATGAGAQSDLTVQGSNVQAAGNVSLQAQHDVQLLAAQNTSSERSKNSSSSAAIGGTLGNKEFGVTVSGSQGKGRGIGDETSYVDTRVEAGQRLTLQSGADTTLSGAVAKGQQVTANVGGNLNAQSLQETSTYDSNQRNVSGGVTIGPKPGGNAAYSQTKINSNYVSVVEQSGIQAGDQGFTVTVNGATVLTGAVIASTDKAVQDGENSLTTASLQTSDIQNKADYKATAYSVSLGTSAGQSSAGFGSDSGRASSTTTAGISGIAGDKAVRTGDAQQGIGKIFDQAQVSKEVGAQVAITSAFGQQAAKAVGDYAGKQEQSLKQQAQAAKQAGDNELAARLKADADKWAQGGAYRVAMHTVVGGLGGGLAGAAAAPQINQLQDTLQDGLQQAGVNANVAKGIASLAGNATATALGAAVGGLAGASTALNQDANNRQLHPSERQRIEALAKQKAQAMCRGDSSCVVSATLYWSDMLERAAEGRVDKQDAQKNQAMYEQIIAAAGKKGSQASMGMAENFFGHLGEAQRMLNADAGKPILDSRGNVVLGSDGKPQTYFSATPAQRENPYGNIFPGGAPNTQASVIPGKDLREQSLLERMGTPSGQAVPDTTIEEALIGVRVPGKGLGSVVKVTERGAAGALPGTAKAAEEALLRSGGAFDKAGNALLDMSKLTTEQKRVVGEQLFGPNTVRQIVPDGKQLARVQGQGSNGIDELYKVNRPDVDYVSVEYTFVGQDSKTGAQVLKNTADGRQGSESWLGGSGRLEKSVGADLAIDVDKALGTGRVESWVVTVRPDGSTAVEVLDAMGKAKPIDTSKIIPPKQNLSGAKP
jgi:filamentous hemagglutinin